MNPLHTHFPWMNEGDEEWLRTALLRLAANNFEEAGQRHEAAECLAELGDSQHASELFLQTGDTGRAAQTLLSAGHYPEALDLYRQWEAALPSSDVLNRVKALLGQAACHHLGLVRSETPSPFSLKEAKTAYRQARALIESEAALSHPAPSEIPMRERRMRHAHCWAALGDYGARLNRSDLVQMGYEQALSCLDTTAPEAVKVKIAEEYLDALQAQGDRLLSASLRERMAVWDETEPPPGWYKHRQAIEIHPFRDGIRDALHFTHPEQREAWITLAEMENEPEVDAYLRTLAPEGMVYIPAGPFLMGSTEDDPDADDDEKPQHEVRLRGFYMDRYPVTNAQYEKFTEAGGYETRDYWTEEGWKQKESAGWTTPRYWDNERFNGAQQPVVGVSWYEAVAYARWAGKALPTEAQWEKAASWDPEADRKRKYPWGDEWEPGKCNTKEENKGKTTEVTTYSPQGDSYYGVGDLGGNVWEWCSTRWDDEKNKLYEYPYNLDDGRENMEHGGNLYRVRRGGSWYLEGKGRSSRCGFRYGSYPWIRDYVRGFRCIFPHALSEFWILSSES